MNPLTEARNANALLARDLRQLARKRERDLELWTRDKRRWAAEKKLLRRRERELLKLLALYLAGDVSEEAAAERLKAVA